jgi:predicted nucleic acid-binding protein
MTPRVYIETSIISYLTARTSRNVVAAGKQKITRDWWRGRREYGLVTSEIVHREASAGDLRASARRLEALRDIPVLGITDEVTRLADDLLMKGALPKRASDDALHISIAAVCSIDYLLTWNCKHIANAIMRATIEEICRSSGLRPPTICTPMELPMGVRDETP